MPIPSTHKAPTWGYTFAAQQLTLPQSLPSYSTKHFIGAVINETTGNVLEYRHLIKLDKTRKFGPPALPTSKYAYSRASETSKAPTRASSSAKHRSHNTNVPYMVASVATYAHKKRRYTAPE
jgi:hypothetical protein